MLISNKPKVGDGKSGIYFNSDGIEYAKGSGKSNAQKLSKSQILAKSGKKLLKFGSSSNLNAKKPGQTF